MKGPAGLGGSVLAGGLVSRVGRPQSHALDCAMDQRLLSFRLGFRGDEGPWNGGPHLHGVKGPRDLDETSHHSHSELAPDMTLAGDEVLATSGALEVRVSTSQADIEASQALRYQVFYEEMSAQPSAEMEALRRDFDDFDKICDHLLVFDRSAPPREDGGVPVVGTYRLLRQDVADSHSGFYTADEYDISLFEQRMGKGTRFLELGRSCTHRKYRTKPTIELLWRGIMAYVARHDLDVMFGCASIEGTDPDRLAVPLSFLYHEYLAPADWRVRAVDARFVDMNRLPKEEIDLRTALKALPPLIKGYIRAGAYIGDGAVVDHQFGTTDVLIIFPVSEINDRYFSRFGADGERE